MIPGKAKVYRIGAGVIMALGIVVAIGYPGKPPTPTREKVAQCISGEYVITKSVVAPRDDKALQIIAEADENSYRIADQSKTALLVRDVLEEPDSAYINDQSPSPVDGHTLIPEEEATLCDSLRRHNRDQRRSNIERTQDGETPQIVRRVPCECNYVITQEQTKLQPTDPKLALSWQYADLAVKLHAPEAWAITTGSPSTVVAVVDSGIDYKHPDLAPNLWVNPEEIAGDLKDNDSNGFIDDVNGASALSGPLDIMDEGGHGTHVSGIIAAAANNNEGTAGMMWKASLMAVRVFDATGTSSYMTVIKGTDYVTMMKGRGVNIAVANYSLGGKSYSDALYQAFKKQSEAGITTVVAAGNEKANNDVTPSYPANFNLPGLISVAALESGGYHADYSNYGKTTVHLHAPGSGIYSTYPTDLGSYATISGTSMASPHVAGVVGLLASRAPALSPAEAASVITNNGGSIYGLSGVTITGRALDAQASLLGAPAHNSAVSGTILRSGSPLTGANISFVNGAAKFSVSTDSKGAFSAKVRPGTYTLTPYKYRVDFSPPSQTVTVSADGNVTLSFTAKDQPFFPISGKVVPGDGISPVNGTLITVLDSSNYPVFYARTLADGTFTTDTLAPGTYLVRAEPSLGQSFTPPSQTVTITTGPLTGVNFTLNQNTPLILEQPASVTVNEGDPFTLKVTSGGTGLTYQWYRGYYTTIPGATSATYTVQSASAADQAAYNVMVKSSAGTQQSATAYVKVMPVLLTDLKDVTVNEGNDAEFMVTAKATGLTSEWYVDGQYYSSCANATVCKIATKGSAPSRSVTVVIKNSAGSAVQSRRATLTVLPPVPVISTFDAPVSVQEGTTAQFGVYATGPALTYQWYKNGTAIPGETTPTLSIQSVPYEDSGSTIRVVVKNAGGSAQREGTLKVTLLKPFIYDVTPFAGTARVGLPLTLSAKATGRNLTYQWYHKGAPIAGATSASYTIPSVSESHAGFYEVTATNESGSSRGSTTISIAPKAPPTIVYQPTNTSAHSGQPAQFLVTGYNISTYQWYRDGVALAGEVGAVLTIPSVTLKDSGAKFFVELSNSDGTLRSDTVTLTVTDKPLNFTLPLYDTTYTEGTSATLKVAVDAPTATFTWYKNNVMIPGVSSSSYTFQPAPEDSGARFKVVATSEGRLSAESTALITVQTIAPPKFSYFWGPAKVIAGGNFYLSGSLDTTWDKIRIYKDDVEVPDSNNLYYSKIATLSDSGTYFARAWKGSKYTDSDKVTVVVEPPTLLVAALPTKLSVKVGQKVTLTASASTNLTSTLLQYQWFRNGAPIRSATSNSLRYKVTAADKKATLSVIVSVGDLKVASSRTTIVLKK